MLQDKMHKAAYRDLAQGPYTTKERDLFVNDISDISLLYSYVLYFGYTEIE